MINIIYAIVFNMAIVCFWIGVITVISRYLDKELEDGEGGKIND